MKAFLAVVLLLASIAKANPIATVDAKKVWERCIVVLDKQVAHVSCAVGYTTQSDISSPLYIAVPVFVPQDTPKEEFATMIKAKLEFESGGPTRAPIRYEDRGADKAPAGTKLVDCVFIFNNPPAAAFAIVASYQQPVHNRRFHYYPQFEDGARPRDSKSFSVTCIPSGDTEMELISKKTTSDRVLATRISIVPEHGKMITIAVK